MNDKHIAEIARRLVQSFLDFAYSRQEDDRKSMLAAQVELVRAVKEEAVDASNS